tara:strand:+ start:7925 stop:8665 length:741 start_codon:yes stop_codon:yes gene_type:complete
MKDKVCIITGSGKGFGLETAKTFAKKGAKLALISRTKEDLIRLENELNIGDNLIWMDGDVSDSRVVDEFVSKTYDFYGKIDILFNNAGMRFRKGFLDTTYDEWKKVIDNNLGSTFLFCQAVGRYMIKQKYGKIINMSSIVGTLGLPELCTYGASKGGIIGLTKSLSLEWAEHNINVNAIAAGFCKTSYFDNFKKNKELYDFTLDRIPMKKWGDPSDIVNACLFLASDSSKYMTGEVLTIDGGWSAW